MALLNNPVARAKVQSLYAAILKVWDEERGRMNEAGCDLCGSNESVNEATGFLDKEAPPYLCLQHRISWGVSCMHNHALLPVEFKFAQWLSKMVHKEVARQKNNPQ